MGSSVSRGRAHAPQSEQLHAPGIAADKEAAIAVFRRIRKMQARGATIMFGDDPEFWKSAPQAPIRFG